MWNIFLQKQLVILAADSQNVEYIFAKAIGYSCRRFAECGIGFCKSNYFFLPQNRRMWNRFLQKQLVILAADSQNVE
jgi:hypothetical protein